MAEKPAAETREAIARLCQIAQRDTGQSRRVAGFLLAWHNAGENGGWDPTDLWNVDFEIAADMLTVVAYVAGNRTYLDEIGFKAEIERIWQLWRRRRKGGDRGASA